ncbi:MAG TPA: TetR/AcrR family transcriptional regulator [Burkholderiaceae bacterium]|nr:TetR/AcrR family transcriptional regulator [Burkholderiaceae bacterium]
MLSFLGAPAIWSISIIQKFARAIGSGRLPMAASLGDNRPMGHSRAAKADSHDRIVKVAADRFRELGVDGISVADLMKSAGLTHGGFYRHFGSRADLVAEAIQCALDDGSVAVDAIAVKPGATLGALVDAYLSLAHRDNLTSGCAVTTLANDVVRSGDRVRGAYTRQVRRYVEVLERLMERVPPKKRHSTAVAALATLVGAVAMARAVNDEKLSREILKASAAALKARFAQDSIRPVQPPR